VEVYPSTAFGRSSTIATTTTTITTTHSATNALASGQASDRVTCSTANGFSSRQLDCGNSNIHLSASPVASSTDDIKENSDHTTRSKKLSSSGDSEEDHLFEEILKRKAILTSLQVSTMFDPSLKLMRRNLGNCLSVKCCHNTFWLYMCREHINCCFQI
jgi:hypothetical protein